MKPVISSASSVDRTNLPQLLELPEEAIAAIIRQIDEADNQTLSHLAQSCHDLWRLASVDALRSFFYAAHNAYESGDTTKRVAVYCILVDWISLVADQLPEESRLQIFEMLADMGKIDSDDPNHLSKMYRAIESMADLALRDFQKKIKDDKHSIEDARDSGTSVHLMIVNQKFLSLFEHYANALSMQMHQTSEALRDFMRPPST